MAIFEILEEVVNDVVMLIAALGIILLTTLIVIRRTLPKPGKNPFSLEYLRAPDPLEHDQMKRNRVIKQREYISITIIIRALRRYDLSVKNIILISPKRRLKGKGFHSLIAEGAVGVRPPLCLEHC